VPRIFVYVVVALVSIASFAVRSIRASRRESKRIADAMAALGAPPPPPPGELLALGLGEPLRWTRLSDGRLVSLHPSALVVVTGAAVTVRIPVDEITRAAATRTIATVQSARANYDSAMAGDVFELIVTWTRPGEPEPQLFVFRVDDARDWEDAISAARRAARA
jgi:hypothetical protein